MLDFITVLCSLDLALNYMKKVKAFQKEPLVLHLLQICFCFVMWETSCCLILTITLPEPDVTKRIVLNSTMYEISNAYKN